MDIFRFMNPEEPTKMQQGLFINGFKSKMWIERYREAGEFSLVANIDTGIKDLLPIGSFISHIDTDEIMVVENHEITDEKGKEIEIVITGRGFETILENRIVGSNRPVPFAGTIENFILPAQYSWLQAVSLIQNHISPDYAFYPDDAIPRISVSHDISRTSVEEERSVPRGDLYSKLIELLKVDNLGIKVVRPRSGIDTNLIIHEGADRRRTVAFSYDTGEIETAEYLWSIKNLKNSAFVSGRWTQVRVDMPGTSGYSRRMMYVDASDIDNGYSEAPPEGPERDAIISQMQQRGLVALASQKNVAIAKVEVSRESIMAVYRQDFNVGDLITVHGDYNELSTKRVSEYVEIEDENGKSSYPTLSEEGDT